MSSQYVCQHCRKKYKLKENFDKHEVACEFLYQMKWKSHDELVDLSEPLPSHRDMFHMIKTVMLKNRILETELKQLKNVVNARHKKEVLEWLNQTKNNQMETFMEWYQAIPVDEEDLKVALNNDLTQAIEHILKKNTGKNVPICRFKEKPNQLFVFGLNSVVADATILKNSENDLSPKEFEEEAPCKKWRLANHIEIEKMVVFLSRALLKLFVKWQNENRAFFVENEKNKDLEIVYMSRITGIKNPLEKRTADIKKWLYGFPEICSPE